MLNYPLFFALRDVFMSNPSSSLSKLHDAWLQLAATFKDVGALGNFAASKTLPAYFCPIDHLSLDTGALESVPSSSPPPFMLTCALI